MYTSILIKEIDSYLRKVEDVFEKVNFNEVDALSKKAIGGATCLVEIDTKIQIIDEQFKKSESKTRRSNKDVANIEKEIEKLKKDIDEHNQSIKKWETEISKIDAVFSKEKRLKFKENGPSFLDKLLGGAGRKEDLIKEINKYESRIDGERKNIEKVKKEIALKEKEIRNSKTKGIEAGSNIEDLVREKESLLLEKAKYEKNFVGAKGNYDIDDLSNYLSAQERKKLLENFLALHSISLSEVSLLEFPKLVEIFALSFDDINFSGEHDKTKAKEYFDRYVLISCVDKIHFKHVSFNINLFNGVEFITEKGKTKPCYDRTKYYKENNIKTDKYTLSMNKITIPQRKFLEELKVYLQQNFKINLPEVLMWINEKVLATATQKEEKNLYKTRKYSLEEFTRLHYLTPEQILVEDNKYDEAVKIKQEPLEEQIILEEAKRVCRSCIYEWDCRKRGTAIINCATYHPRSR